MKSYLKDLFRPWKLVLFIVGLGFFVWGAVYWNLRTWDVPVSIIMSVLCFLFSPFAVRGIIRSLKTRDPLWGLKLIFYLAVVYAIGSGSYEIYNTIRLGHHPVTYVENLLFSIPTTLAAGLVWSYKGTLKELLREISLPTAVLFLFFGCVSSSMDNDRTDLVTQPEETADPIPDPKVEDNPPPEPEKSPGDFSHDS